MGDYLRAPNGTHTELGRPIVACNPDWTMCPDAGANNRFCRSNERISSAKGHEVIDVGVLFPSSAGCKGVRLVYRTIHRLQDVRGSEDLRLIVEVAAPEARTPAGLDARLSLLKQLQVAPNEAFLSSREV